MLASFLLSTFLLLAPYEEINMMQVKETIFNNYYKELPDSIKVLPWTKLKEHLDPYTRILNKKDIQEFQKEISMVDNGVVGISIDTSDSGFYIDEIYVEGSAYKQGLMRGDIIRKVNNKIPKNRENLSKLIRGKEGSAVELEVLRKDKILKFKLERNEIHYSNVYSVKLEKTALIRIESFHEMSFVDFSLHSMALKPSMIDTLIIDLRYNGGGLLYDCLMMCDEFFHKNQLICSRVQRKDTINDYTKFDNGLWLQNKTIIILQNEWTASASELFAATIKYGRNAIVVGNKSFGKGVVQTQFEVQNGRVFVTSSEYYPLGKIKIHNKGIEPDYPMGEYILNYDHLDFDLRLFREQYPHPSVEALRDERLSGKTHISHLIWEMEGELFEILMQKPYISK
jgi:carboxyl-terminal processing protease